MSCVIFASLCSITTVSMEQIEFWMKNMYEYLYVKLYNPHPLDEEYAWTWLSKSYDLRFDSYSSIRVIGETIRISDWIGESPESHHESLNRAIQCWLMNRWMESDSHCCSFAGCAIGFSVSKSGPSQPGTKSAESGYAGCEIEWVALSGLLRCATAGSHS